MAKQIIYGEEARKALQTGIDTLANTVENHLGSQRPQRGFGQKIRFSADHQ